jgi:homoserine O-acetyltransferase
MLASWSGAAGAQASPNPLLLAPDDERWSEHSPDAFRAVFETTKGTFIIDVQRARAPLGADRFFNLVRHGFYDGVRFNRVIAGFIAQWGVSGHPEVTRVWKSRSIPDDPVRQSNVRGTIAFAMTGPDTRTTQVYISLADNSRLDAQGFAPFGRIVDGMDVVDRLHAGYGENAGGGVRAGRQGPIEEGGNAWLDREFPLLDHILRARVESGR